MNKADQVSRRLKLRQLEVLLAVAKCGSMAKGAEQLSITQPVVSKAIADLETTLGVRLFDRTSKGIEPTSYGRALLARSVAVFNDLRTVVTELEHLSDPTAGELRIGSSDAVLSGLLGVILDRLSSRYPRLRFEVELAELPYEELQARNLDLVIGRFPSTLADDLMGETLYHERMFVVCGNQNPLASRQKLSLPELIHERWCLPPLETFPWSRIGDAFRKTGLEPPSRIVTARSIMLRINMAISGSFLTILPGSMLHFRSKAFQLKILPVRLPIEPFQGGIVTLKDRTPTPAAKLFVECAREFTMPLRQIRMR